MELSDHVKNLLAAYGQGSKQIGCCLGISSRMAGKLWRENGFSQDQVERLTVLADTLAGKRRPDPAADPAADQVATVDLPPGGRYSTTFIQDAQAALDMFVYLENRIAILQKRFERFEANVVIR